MAPTPQVATAWRIVTPASATLPLDPAATAARLGAKDVALVEGYIAASGALIEADLGYPLAYQEYEQDFFHVEGDSLQLKPRPLVSLISLKDADGEALEDGDDFRLIQSDGRLYRRGGWALGFLSDVLRTLPLLPDQTSPDWTVRFTAGYWLPGMDGAPPAGVTALNPAIAAAAFITAADFHAGEAENPRIASFAQAGASLVLRDTGYALPPRACHLLSPFRIPRI
jgi:hypothetical protein